MRPANQMPTTEEAEVKKFLEASKEFKMLQSLLVGGRDQEIIAAIQKSRTFSELLTAIALKNNLPPMAVTVPLTFVMGYFDASANQGYYMLWLNKHARDKMVELGYKHTAPSLTPSSTPAP